MRTTKKHYKQVAKIGMVASLGVTCITGMAKSSMRVHNITGIAFVALCAWHTLLYQKKRKVEQS